MALRLGDLLVRNGLLTPEQRDDVLTEQWETGRPFGYLAERMFGVSEAAVEQAWADQYAMLAEHVDPRIETIDAGLLSLVERRQAWQFCVLPMRFDLDELILCTIPDRLPRALRFAGWRINHPCYFVLAEPLHLGHALARYYPIAGMTPQMISGVGFAA